MACVGSQRGSRGCHRFSALASRVVEPWAREQGESGGRWEKFGMWKREKRFCAEAEEQRLPFLEVA